MILYNALYNGVKDSNPMLLFIHIDGIGRIEEGQSLFRRCGIQYPPVQAGELQEKARRSGCERGDDLLDNS